MKKMFFAVKYSKKERFLIYNTVNSNQYANVINSNIVTVLPWLVKLKFPHIHTYIQMSFKSWISCKEETKTWYLLWCFILRSTIKTHVDFNFHQTFEYIDILKLNCMNTGGNIIFYLLWYKNLKYDIPNTIYVEK